MQIQITTLSTKATWAIPLTTTKQCPKKYTTNNKYATAIRTTSSTDRASDAHLRTLRGNTSEHVLFTKRSRSENKKERLLQSKSESQLKSK